jgi:antirestriction protein ArdC
MKKGGKPYEPIEAPKRWSELLASVIDTPGELSKAFSMFHHYSFGNVMLTWAQLSERELPLAPIATYNGWLRVGRQVRKDEASLILCVPCTVRKENKKTGETEVFSLFRYRKGWFSLSQTDGDPVPMPELPNWDYKRALATLQIKEEPFEQSSDPKEAGRHFTLTPLSGNTLGYFRRSTRSIHISPLNTNPLHTVLHEIAHAELHGDREGAQEDRDIKELEAELVGMLIGDALGFDFATASRGYVQDWMKGRDITEVLTDERSKKLIKVADRILTAGQVQKKEEAAA